MMVSTATSPIADQLAEQTRVGDLWQSQGDNKVRCVACGHRCLIPEGRTGVCKVRFNDEGILHVPHGYIAGLQTDPIEKKPFYHLIPGSLAQSFGMLGCDYHCAYCQNWNTSQVLRDPASSGRYRRIDARDIVQSALAIGAKTITSTYNEPLITAEWSHEVFSLATQENLYTSFVSNGNATTEVINYMLPVLDAMKVDLKSFSDRNYRTLGGTLDAVLRTIEMLAQSNVWLELVTLLVHGFNDEEAELREMAAWIASVDPGIPWHVTAFHEDYNLRGIGNTPRQAVLRAVEIGREAGLTFVYPGNIACMGTGLQDTVCPHCQTTLIERNGYQMIANRITRGACHTCHAAVPGIWGQ